MTIRNKFLLTLVALGSSVCVSSAVNLELALCIDASGSIGSTAFNLQKQGYYNALSALLPTDGSVAVGVWKFTTADSLVFSEQIISSAADKTALLNAINGMTYTGGNTALGPSIVDAYTRLVQNDIVGTRKIIDVSTDGEGNVGISQVTARNNALAAGIDQVNGVLVGAAASSTFVGGAGSFYEVATTYADFETALSRKIQKEVYGTPDIASTLSLMGFGFVALAGVRRRLA
jgi:hypothetical protein